MTAREKLRRRRFKRDVRDSLIFAIAILTGLALSASPFILN